MGLLWCSLSCVQHGLSHSRGAGAKSDAIQIASLNSPWPAAAISGNFPSEDDRTAFFHTCRDLGAEQAAVRHDECSQIMSGGKKNKIYTLQESWKDYIIQKHCQTGDKGENWHQKSCKTVQDTLFGGIFRRIWHVAGHKIFRWLNN